MTSSYLYARFNQVSLTSLPEGTVQVPSEREKESDLIHSFHNDPREDIGV